MNSTHCWNLKRNQRNHTYQKVLEKFTIKVSKHYLISIITKCLLKSILSRKYYHKRVFHVRTKWKLNVNWNVTTIRILSFAGCFALTKLSTSNCFCMFSVSCMHSYLPLFCFGWMFYDDKTMTKELWKTLWRFFNEN